MGDVGCIVQVFIPKGRIHNGVVESECRETNPRKRSGSHNNSVRAVKISGTEQVLRSTPRVSFHPLLHKTCAVTNTLRIGLCGCVVTVVPNVLVRNRCIVGRTPHSWSRISLVVISTRTIFSRTSWSSPFTCTTRGMGNIKP